MNELNYTAPGGLILSNYGTTVLANNTANSRTLTVPNGKRWILFGGDIYNADNVARACTVRIVSATDEQIVYFFNGVSIGAGAHGPYPSISLAGGLSTVISLPLKEGWKIYFYWAAGGASAGGTATSSALVLEVPY